MPWSESLRGRQIVLAGGSGGLGSPLAALLADEGASLAVSYLRRCCAWTAGSRCKRRAVKVDPMAALRRE